MRKNWAFTQLAISDEGTVQHLVPFTMEMILVNNNEAKLNLYKAVDNIQVRFGKTSIKKR